MDKNPEIARNNRKEAGVRLRSFREDTAKMERDEFALHLGSTYDKQESYENGRSFPPPEYWKMLADKFPEADVSLLMLGIPSAMKAFYSERRVPILNSVPAGTLNFSYADEEIQGYLFTINDRDKDIFALQIKGDSMLPEIKSGDYVLCAPDRPFRNADINVVVTSDSEATCKRVFKRNSGYELVPENPEFESVFVEDEKIIRLIPVVEIQRRIRS